MSAVVLVLLRPLNRLLHPSAVMGPAMIQAALAGDAPVFEWNHFNDAGMNSLWPKLPHTEDGEPVGS